MSIEKERIVIQQISEKIRLRREELSLSRSALALETGLDEKQIRRIENSESTLPIVTLLKICFVLKLNLDFLEDYLKDDSILL